MERKEAAATKRALRGVDGDDVPPPIEERIVLVSRSADSAGQEKSQIDNVAAQYISENVRFPALEGLSGNIEESSTFKDLRGNFPRRHDVHPCLVRLTDNTLEDYRAFQDAVRGTPPKSAALENPKELLPRNCMKSRVTRKASFETGHQTKQRRIRREKSAPAIY